MHITKSFFRSFLLKNTVTFIPSLNCVQETKDATLNDRCLQADFLKICEGLIRFSVHPVDCPKPLIRELFSEILSRVISTMMNSLLQCAAVVTWIQANKGVYTDVALRDKLKVYAAEKESCIKL